MNPNYVGEKQAIDLITEFNKITEIHLKPNQKKDDHPIVILPETHTEQIECISVFPGGKYFVSVGDDYTIKVFNSDGTLFTSIKNEHKDVISSVVVMNDFKFATCSWDKSIKVWKMKGKTFICECTRTFEITEETTTEEKETKEVKVDNENVEENKEEVIPSILDPSMNDFQQILFYEFWKKNEDKKRNDNDNNKKDAFVTASLTNRHNYNPITIYSIGYDQSSGINSYGNVKFPKVSTIDEVEKNEHTHDDKIQSIFQLDEERLISSGLDKKLKIWYIMNNPPSFVRVENNEFKVDVIEDVEPAYYQGAIGKIDKDRIVVGSDNKIQIINVTSKNKTNKFVNEPCYNMLLLKNNLLLVTDNTDSIKLYSTENLTKIEDIKPLKSEEDDEKKDDKKDDKENYEGYQCIVQLKDGSIITSNHGTIKIWSF